MELPIVLMIIVLIIIFLFLIGVAIYATFNIHKNKCTKCMAMIGEVDNYYFVKSFKNSRTRYRCALHPLPGYRRKNFPSKHYSLEVRALSETDQQKLKTERSIIKTITNLPFAKIQKAYNADEKTIIVSLEIDNKKISLDDKKSGIYLITNINTNKKYVGQSKNIQKRWNQHSNQVKDDGFHDKIISDPKSFKYEVLINSPKEYLDFFEAYYISKYDSYNNGYNRTKGNFSHLTNNQIRILNNVSA